MKKVISVILSLCMILTVLPLGIITAIASSTPETTVFDQVEEENKIYYSDLFYGYSYYLNYAPFYNEYRLKTKGILNTVYNEYMDSPKFKWSSIKNALSMTTNVKEWTKLVADAMGYSSFTYEKALDAANADFATHLTGGSEIAKAYGTEQKWIKKINEILKIYDTFDKNYDVSRMTEYEVFEAMFTVVEDSGFIASMSYTHIIELKEDILPHITKITNTLSGIADVLLAAKTIATGIMMEDFRMEMIDEILNNVSSGTMLHDGMLRLKSQLRNGFVSYFMDNYITDRTLNVLADTVVKKLTKLALGDVAGVYAVMGAITKVASWITFDLIFKVPDIDDLTKQMVLCEYADDLYDLVEKNVNSYDTQFENSDIKSLEFLASAYAAATSAALEASEKLKLDTNAEQLTEVADKYSDISFYSNWIESAIDFIDMTSTEGLVKTDFVTWEIEADVKLCGPSDEIEDDGIYCLKTGFNGELECKTSNKITIPKGQTFILNGDFDMSTGSYRSSVLIINGKLDVNGSLVVTSTVYNHGELNIEENLNAVGRYSNFYMYNPDAVLKIGGKTTFRIIYGNIGIIETSACKITGGTVVFNGLSQQEVKGLVAKNILVENTKGVIFADVHLSGLFNSNGNPIEGTYYIYEGISFTPSYNYGDNIVINDDLTLKGNFCGELSNLYPYNVTIPQNETLSLTGRLSISDATVLTNNGTLKVDGTLSVDSVIYNHGELNVTQSLYVNAQSAKFYMYNKNAILRAGGTVYFYILYNNSGTVRTKACNITNGKVILNGSKQQEVTGLLAPVLILENKSGDGVVFKTKLEITTLFNHMGNNFTLYRNGSGSSFVDYDGDGLYDNVDSEPTVGKQCVLNFKSEGSEKGSVSVDSIETVGGTEVSVIATPTEKYSFSKWVNSSGATVSTASNYFFVAKSVDETYTAVFAKRRRPIISRVSGGRVKTMSSAEIESTVTVSIIENDGYMYTDGSLAYNGIPVENWSFVMPDETVIITAEFIKNENYFALSDLITTAKNYSAEGYSVGSFDNLTLSINDAEAALYNHITQSESSVQISKLRSAIERLSYVEQSGLTYKDVDGGVMITGYEGDSDTITIPAEINGKTVVAIDCGAFADDKGIKTVNYEAVDAVCYGTKTNTVFPAKQVMTVNIGKYVETVPSYLFYGAYVTRLNFAEDCALETIESYSFYMSRIGALNIPDSVKSIGNQAFRGSVNLKKITLGKNVESIGQWAFAYTTKLEEAILNDTLYKIDNYAFYGTGLDNITIPYSVGYIGRVDPFGNSNTVIGAYTYSFAAKKYVDSYVDLGIYYTEVDYTDLTYEEVSGGVKITGFMGEFTKYMEIPSEIDGKPVVEIGWKAFFNGTANKSVYAIKLPDSVAKIGGQAFRALVHLHTLEAEGVESYSDSAFMYCSNLDITKIGK